MASVSAGSGVAPYPKGKEKVKRVRNLTSKQPNLTQPLPRRDSNVPIPFTIFDAILVNEPTLERGQFLVYLAHHLRRLDEFVR